MSQSAARHTLLTQPGGAIGLGLPCATGAAIACPDRRVISLQADGSAMYTAAGALDAGARTARRHHDHLQQPQLPHPGHRDGARRREDARRQAQRLIGLTRARDRLGEPGEGHGRARRASRDRGRLSPRARTGARRNRPTSHRGGSVREEPATKAQKNTKDYFDRGMRRCSAAGTRASRNAHTLDLQLRSRHDLIRLRGEFLLVTTGPRLGAAGWCQAVGW